METIPLSDVILIMNQQDDRLAEYDSMFNLRYSEADDEFMKTVSSQTPPPPCVKNWYCRPKRTFNWTRGNPNHQRGGQYNQRGRGQPSWQNQGSRMDNNHDGDYGGRNDSYNRQPYQGDRVSYAGVKRGHDFGERPEKRWRTDNDAPRR